MSKASRNETISPSEASLALLQHNYFPRNAKDASDLPPCFTSINLTPEIANKISGCGEKPTKGFDSVQINLTRFDLVSRAVEIPYPKAYCSLTTEIEKNWKQISHVATNTKSKIRIRKHQDGRIFSMIPADQNNHKASFGASYLVTADISHFYSSIYTHAIAWALGGYEAAKLNTSNNSYYNRIDSLYTGTRRSETSGVSIGPATSAIAAEIILFKVDELLKKYKFERYIDDYRFYAKDEKQANSFLFDLSDALAKYRLSLNQRKTTIQKLPIASSPAWIRQLRDQLDLLRMTKFNRALDYIDQAVELSSGQTNASSLKWALTAIEVEKGFKSKKRRRLMLDPLLSLSFYQPVVIPFLSRMLIQDKSLSMKKYEKRINQIIKIHAQFDRTDCVTWLLYLCKVRNISLRSETVTAVIEKKDCLSLLLLFQFDIADTNRTIIEFCETLFNVSKNNYEVHQYWILLHELKLKNSSLFPKLDNAFQSLSVLRKNGITFLELTTPPSTPAISSITPPPIFPAFTSTSTSRLPFDY